MKENKETAESNNQENNGTSRRDFIAKTIFAESNPDSHRKICRLIWHSWNW